MNKQPQQTGDRNVNAERITESIVITGDDNQVTVNLPPLAQSPAIPPTRLAELWQAYEQSLAARVGTVRIFGDEQPRTLEQVFVELSLNEDYERRPQQAEFLGLLDSELRRMRSVFGDADERREQDPDDPTLRHHAKTKRTIKPDELLRRHTHAVVTGAPGCGKTTLLRYLAWQTLKQWRDRISTASGSERGSLDTPNVETTLATARGTDSDSRLPVFLELKQLTAAAFQESKGQLEDLLFTAAIAARLKPSEAECAALQQQFQELLRTGRVAVFLDGLDEVSGASFFRDLQTAVSEFLSSAYGQNTVIISTRPYALRPFGAAKMLEILPLTPRQIEQFIAHYYRDVPERQQFQRELQRRRELRELARVPALLGFILQLWRKRGSVPYEVLDDKLELYEQITLELAQQLDREKEGIAPDRQWLVEDKDGSLKLDLLRQVAFKQLFKGLIRPPYDIGSTDNDVNRLVFTGEQLRDEAIAFARTLREREGVSINPRNLAEDVKATTLLRQVGADHYAFAHLTLQEYLAAWQLAKRDNGDTCERIFCRAYFNPTLAEMEVLPMTLGLVDEPDKLYEVLELLPESLTFTNIRLRARGVSYGAKVRQQILMVLTGRLIEFVRGDIDEEGPFSEVVVQSFFGLRGKAFEFVTNQAVTLLHNNDRLVRRMAVSALGQIRSEAVIGKLRLALSDVDNGVRWRAAESLGEIGDEVAMGDLRLALRDGDRHVRWYAAKSLGEIGSSVVVSDLHLALRDEDSLVANCAAEALGNIGSEVVLNALVQSLHDENRDVRIHSATALGIIGSEPAVVALLLALRDEDWLVRSSVVKALGQVGGEIVV